MDEPPHPTEKGASEQLGCCTSSRGHVRDTQDARTAITLAVFSLVCILIPFGMFYVSSLLHPGNSEAAGFAVLLPACLVWLLAIGIGLVGAICGIHALVDRRGGISVIAATCINCMPVLIAAFVLIRHWVRALGRGY